MIDLKVKVVSNLAASAVSPTAFWQKVSMDMMAAVQPMYRDIIARTRSNEVKSKYYLNHTSGAFSATVTLSNLSSGWLWEEVTTKPHWPPKGPGTRLDLWADNPYAAAWHVHLYGTTGSYAFTNSLSAHQSRIENEIILKSINSMMDYLIGPRR